MNIIFGGGSVSGEGGGYGFGQISESDSLHLLNYAFDHGIKIFDTAPIYGFGMSEERIGKAFKTMREQVQIISKCGIDWHDTKRVNLDNSAKTTEKMLHASLKRLQTEYIDHYMIHWPDPRVDIRETMEVLVRAKEVGKINAIGLCNTYPEDYFKAKEIGTIDSLQSELNLFSTYAQETLLPLCEKEELVFMSWGTFDKGIITGRVTKDRKFDAVDARAHAPWWKASKPFERVEKMKPVLEYLQSVGHSGVELALSYNSSFKEVNYAIVGARSAEQIDSLLLAFNNKLPAAILEKALSLFVR